MNDIYQTVTERLIAELETGNVPWVRPWSGDADPVPRNALSQRPYRGINQVLLGMESFEQKEIDEFMIRSTNSVPGRRLGHWFVSPWWIVPTATVYLSFRQVDSFEAAVQDFYGRLFAEESPDHWPDTYSASQALSRRSRRLSIR